jgi:hypothetical protein
LFSFGIVILTGFIFYYKTKLQKAETWNTTVRFRSNGF